MKINILFVDDEQDVIDGLKRMLFSMRREWGLFFALSGEEALKIMETNKIDVIVSDMRMPKMDGSELLKIAKERHPEMLRIILSGHQDEMKILRSTVTAHQFLLKPSNAQSIKDMIEKAYSFRSQLENEKLIDIINGIGELTSMPDLYLRLEDEMNKVEFSFEKIKNIISSDPGMTAKILQTVNSGFFGLPRHVTDLLQALSFMGVNTIKSIVLYLQTFSDPNIPAKYMGVCKKIGEHSLIVANMAKTISAFEKQSKKEIEDSFTAGVLHDIGKLILIKIPNFYENLQKIMEEKKVSANQAEEEILGITHHSIGAYLLGIWGLPDSIIYSTAFYHEPMKANCDHFCPLTAIHVANAFDMSNIKDFDETKINVDLQYLDHINMRDKLPDWWNETRKHTRGSND